MQDVVISIRNEADGIAASVYRGDQRLGASKPLPAYGEDEAAALRWILEDFPRLATASAKAPAVMAESRLRRFAGQVSDLLTESLTLAVGDTALDEITLAIDDPDGYTRQWPWELLTWNETPIVFSCRAFVRRVGRMPSRLSAAPPAKPLKLLVVVARPGGIDDVGFRSVASRVIAATSDDAIDVEILRPPTFKALHDCLLDAQQAGDPYDIVHFDGHGSLIETENGERGVLVFEDDSAAEADYIRGSEIGKLLGESDVPLFVLNACHSGAAPNNEPSKSESASAAMIGSASLAEEVASCGAIEIVSMSHAVYVSTAAHVVEDLYHCLDSGHSIGAAVSFARRRWAESAVGRSSALGYSIIRHFGCPTGSAEADSWPEYKMPSGPDDRTPHHPEMQAAFHVDDPYVAADSSILILERALRRTNIVQLNGMRGSGKTALLLELGRWLAASVAEDPGRIAYLDLGTASGADEATTIVNETNAAVLLIDHADCIHGDPLRNVDPWPADQSDAFLNSVADKVETGCQVMLASSAPIPVDDGTERVVMPRLEVDDVRALIELNADRETAEQVPEPALSWTAGNPGVIPILIEMSAADAFVDATRTLETLSELGFGQFSSTKPPLAQIQPLQLPGGALLFEPDVGLPWLLMQFQGQAVLSPILWELATVSGFSSIGEGESHEALPAILENLEKSGLVISLGDDCFLIHPLLPCLIATPYNTEQLGTEGYYRSLMNMQGLFCKYTQVLPSLPFLSEPGPPGVSSVWDLQNLLHAFQCVAGKLQVEHLGALSFARRLRSRFLDMGRANFWAAILERLTEMFEKYPPGPDDGTFNPNSAFLLLRMEEAKRTGDNEMAEDYSRQALAAAAQAPGPGGDSPQVNAYDVGIKRGRQLVKTDKAGALDAFKTALEYAGNDPVRKAKVQLELTRLLRETGSTQDLTEARIYGESALSGYLKLVKAKLCDDEDLALITMSLSLVYKELLETDNPDPSWALRGEDLCRQSLHLSADRSQQATAWFNLGGWRRRAGDFKAATDAFLEAESIYEELGNPLMLAYTLTYSGHALYECGEFLQARLNTVRAVEIMVKLPDKPKDMIRYAYEIAEAAWARFNSGAAE